VQKFGLTRFMSASKIELDTNRDVALHKMVMPGASGIAQTEQQEVPAPTVNTPPPQAAPFQGGRAAFRSITRTLSDNELTTPGVQKLILEMLEPTERERDEYKTYLPLYFEAGRSADTFHSKLPSAGGMD